MPMETLSYTIKSYPAELRPMERMERIGPEGLSDRELLAILVHTGLPNLNALDIADILLKACRGLRGFADLAMPELEAFPGIGQGKAARILAAVELGKRMSLCQETFKPAVGGSQDAANLLLAEARYLDREIFRAMLLNTKNQVLAIETVSMGSLNASLVHPREVFKAAIRKSAAAIILSHNHPSGDPSPSEEDRLMTRRLEEAGLLIGIPVLDHIITGENNYFSFKEMRLL